MRECRRVYGGYAMPILLVFLSITLAACTPVKPWPRGYLSKPEMAWDPDPLESTLRQHVYFSKEASSGGGATAGGGGCGCN